MVEHERTGLLDLVTWSFSRVAMWLPAFIVSIIFYEVVMRYVFERPTLWVNEMAVWLGAMIYLLAGVYAMQRRSHIRITALYDAVPRTVQRVFDTISLLVILLYVFAMVFAGWDIALNSLLTWERYGTAFNPPVPATIRPLVHIAAILVAVQAISNYVVDIRKERPDQPAATSGVD